MGIVPDSSPFAFEIGDFVHCKTNKKTCQVVARISYPAFGPDKIFYTIKQSDDSVWMVKEEDIEALNGPSTEP